MGLSWLFAHLFLILFLLATFYCNFLLQTLWICSTIVTSRNRIDDTMKRIPIQQMTHYVTVHIQIGCAVERIYTCRPSSLTCVRTLTFCFAIFLDRVSCNPTCLDDCTCFHATVCAPSLTLVLEWWRDFLKPQAWLNSFIFTWKMWDFHFYA